MSSAPLARSRGNAITGVPENASDSVNRHTTQPTPLQAHAVLNYGTQTSPSIVEPFPIFQSTPYVKVWSGTWNIGAKDPIISPPNARQVLGDIQLELPHFIPPDYDIYVLGVQEGRSDLIFDQVGLYLRRFGVSKLPCKSQVHGRGDGSFLFTKFTGIAVYVTNRLLPYVNILAQAEVSLGITEGSKGAAAVLLMVCGSTLACIATHMPASSLSNRIKAHSALLSELGGSLCQYYHTNAYFSTCPTPHISAAPTSVDPKHEDLHLHGLFHHVIFLGDTNFRLHDITAQEVLEHMAQQGAANYRHRADVDRERGRWRVSRARYNMWLRQYTQGGVKEPLAVKVVVGELEKEKEGGRREGENTDMKTQTHLPTGVQTQPQTQMQTGTTAPTQHIHSHESASVGADVDRGPDMRVEVDDETDACVLTAPPELARVSSHSPSPSPASSTSTSLSSRSSSGGEHTSNDSDTTATERALSAPTLSSLTNTYTNSDTTTTAATATPVVSTATQTYTVVPATLPVPLTSNPLPPVCRTGLWAVLQHDELARVRRSLGIFHGFSEPTMAPSFFPSYKRKEGRSVIDWSDAAAVDSIYRTQYKEPWYKSGRVSTRVPAFTDRVLVASSGFGTTVRFMGGGRDGVRREGMVEDHGERVGMDSSTSTSTGTGVDALTEEVSAKRLCMGDNAAVAQFATPTFAGNTTTNSQTASFSADMPAEALAATASMGLLHNAWEGGVVSGRGIGYEEGVLQNIAGTGTSSTGTGVEMVSYPWTGMRAERWTEAQTSFARTKPLRVNPLHSDKSVLRNADPALRSGAVTDSDGRLTSGLSLSNAPSLSNTPSLCTSPSLCITPLTPPALSPSPSHFPAPTPPLYTPSIPFTSTACNYHVVNDALTLSDHAPVFATFHMPLPHLSMPMLDTAAPMAYTRALRRLRNGLFRCEGDGEAGGKCVEMGAESAEGDDGRRKGGDSGEDGLSALSSRLSAFPSLVPTASLDDEVKDLTPSPVLGYDAVATTANAPIHSDDAADADITAITGVHHVDTTAIATLNTALSSPTVPEDTVCVNSADVDGAFAATHSSIPTPTPVPAPVPAHSSSTSTSTTTSAPVAQPPRARPTLPVKSDSLRHALAAHTHTLAHTQTQGHATAAAITGTTTTVSGEAYAAPTTEVVTTAPESSSSSSSSSPSSSSPSSSSSFSSPFSIPSSSSSPSSTLALSPALLSSPTLHRLSTICSQGPISLCLRVTDVKIVKSMRNMNINVSNRTNMGGVIGVGASMNNSNVGGRNTSNSNLSSNNINMNTNTHNNSNRNGAGSSSREGSGSVHDNHTHTPADTHTHSYCSSLSPAPSPPFSASSSSSSASSPRLSPLPTSALTPQPAPSVVSVELPVDSIGVLFPAPYEQLSLCPRDMSLASAVRVYCACPENIIPKENPERLSPEDSAEGSTTLARSYSTAVSSFDSVQATAESSCVRCGMTLVPLSLPLISDTWTIDSLRSSTLISHRQHTHLGAHLVNELRYASPTAMSRIVHHFATKVPYYSPFLHAVVRVQQGGLQGQAMLRIPMSAFIFPDQMYSGNADEETILKLAGSNNQSQTAPVRRMVITADLVEGGCLVQHQGYAVKVKVSVEVFYVIRKVQVVRVAGKNS